jgi:hypothetical protein
VEALARSVTAEAETPYDAARLVEAYLRANYTFALDVPAPAPRRDAIAHFLFEERRGYFDHFASSMAVMLRSVGIPARVSVGFALDDAAFDATTRRYLVSERSAWAWPEVYFPGLGWVEFNPTPTRGLVTRPGDDSAALAAAAAARGGLSDLDELLEELLLEEIDVGGLGAFQDLEAGEAFIVGGRAGEVLVRLLTWLLLLSAIGFVGLMVARFFWERSFRGLLTPARRWAKVSRLASWAGVLPADHHTPAEVATVLGQALGEPTAMRALARSYTRSRYGREKESEESEDDARLLDEQYRRVRGRLWRRVVRRVLRGGAVDHPPHALPPLARGYAPGAAARR